MIELLNFRDLGEVPSSAPRKLTKSIDPSAWSLTPRISTSSSDNFSIVQNMRTFSQWVCHLTSHLLRRSVDDTFRSVAPIAGRNTRFAVALFPYAILSLIQVFY
jgi:hypothetical protein